MKNRVLIIILICVSFLSFGQQNHLSDHNKFRKVQHSSYFDYQKMFSSLKMDPDQYLTAFQKLDSLNLETYLGENNYKTLQSRQWQHNNLGQITSFLYYRDIADYGMYLDFKIDYTYDSNFDKSTKIYYRKNTEDELSEYSRNLYNYDSNHQLIEDIYSVRLFDDEEFTNQSQKIYTWNSANQLETIKINDWDSDQNGWIFEEQQNFYYSNEGILDSLLIQYWITEENTWKDFYLYKYEHNENQDLTSEEAFIQYLDINYWEKRYKRDYIFDEEGNNIERLTFSVKSSDNSWLMNDKTSWSYDEYGNIIETYKYDWDENNEIWMTLSKHQEFYDYNYTKDEVIIPLDYDLFTDVYEFYEVYDAQNMWLNSQFFRLNSDTQEWEHTGRTSLYYSNIEVSNTNNIKTIPVTIYPNPTTDALYIDCNKETYTEILNLSGKKIHSSYHQTIDISHLEKGIYFMRIKSDKELIKTQKIIKL